MESQNQDQQNGTVEQKENSNVPKVKKSVSPKKEKKEKSTDSINIDKIKVDVSKGKKDLLTKERSASGKKDLYKGTSELSSEEKKKHRGKIRRELHKFCNNILGKDRSAEERTKNVKDFLKFYKDNWKVQDFKIENFSHSQNPTDQKDYKALLQYVQSVLK